MDARDETSIVFLIVVCRCKRSSSQLHWPLALRQTQQRSLIVSKMSDNAAVQDWLRSISL